MSGLTLTSLNTAGTALAGGAIDFGDNALTTTITSQGALQTGISTTGTVNLTIGSTPASSASVTEASGGSITAATLTGTVAAAANFNEANKIGTLGQFTANDFSLTNARSLTVTGPVTEPTAFSGGIGLTTTGAGSNLILAGPSPAL